MSKASDYLETQVLDALFNGGTLGSITPHLALFTAAPTDSGGGTEVSGGSYARVDVSSNFAAASGTSGSLSNNSDVTFAQASASWGSVTSVGVFDAASGGNLLLYGDLTAAVTVDNGDVFKIPSGSFTATVA